MSGQIGYAGMTHLGIVSALAAAERGFSVLGYDPDVARTEALSAGNCRSWSQISPSCWRADANGFDSAPRPGRLRDATS